MSNKQLKLTYALKNGAAVNIADVEKGLKCNCVCPACGDLLVAKKGNKVMHHFAHHTGSSCEYGYETSLHLAAKEIISQAKKLFVPPVFLDFPGSNKDNEQLFEAKEIIVDKVELEKRYDNIVPDIIVYSGGKKLIIEIFVTHMIDEEKIEKIQKLNFSTIEIDLSHRDETITREELTEILLNNSSEKKWIYNAVAQRYLQKFYSVSDKRPIISRGLALHVDDCPIKSRIWKGKPYANFFHNCLYCKYCISVNNNGSIFCSGRLRIATLKDFDIPEEKRIKDSNDEIDDIKEMAFFAGNCPNCGGELKKRNSQYGEFIGCGNYPHCKFTATIDTVTGELKMNYK